MVNFMRLSVLKLLVLMFGKDHLRLKTLPAYKFMYCIYKGLKLKTSEIYGELRAEGVSYLDFLPIISF